jgi:hypothetical protein
MSTDAQDNAEATDEEMIDGDEPTSSHEAVMFPPDHPRAVPFADADVSDESVADRAEQETPEISEQDINENDAADTGPQTDTEAIQSYIRELDG